MEKYADGHDLPPTMFRFESREPRGDGKEVGVFAFKAYHVRVYGVLVPDGEKSAFVCSEIDTAKKQDKADQAKLTRAAQNVCSLFEE